MSLKPWREIAIPHEDVLKGTFQQAEFAADLSRVHGGTAREEYQNPVRFFERTFITEGMRLLLDSVVRRLAGKGGDPVIQLQTAFGGGKTHTMLAVYHLAKGEVPAGDLPGVPPILDAAGVTELPRARVAVLDGVDLLGLAGKPRVHEGCTVRTLWGELAWQLGGEAGYARVREADETGTAPGKAELAQLLAAHAPCVILVDELVRYVSQFEEGKALSGGTFDANLSFVQALTEALKAVPTAVMLASLPESEKEAGSERGVRALATLAHYFGRVQALWKPVATEEAFEIVRRRLFASIGDRQAAEAVCRAFADHYLGNRQEFPQETQEGRYLDRLIRAYPIHPEVFDRLYEDWSSLENFQRTRGVLKLMAKIIHRLWQDGNNDLLILPGSLPLYDVDVRNEAIYYLPQGWDPVIERDVDGERSEPWEIENRDPRLGGVQACRRVARTIFLGSAPHSVQLGANQLVRGLEQERVLLGVAQPGQPLGVFKDALSRLTDRLHYLNHAQNRYWFDTRPNLRREMEERKRRFHEREDVFPTIRDRLQRQFATGVFGGIHVFTASGDVPDDWLLRLVVLPPDAAFSKSGKSPALEHASEILRKRGEQPRFKQNRLIFLAADQDSVLRLKDLVRSYLAWRSIVEDYRDNRLVLDNLMARQAQESLAQAEKTVGQAIRETYKWLLVPGQEALPGRGLSEVQWQALSLNAGAPNWSQEIERVLKENELLITVWAPIHLARMLREWFWKDGVKEAPALNVWQQSCQQLYLPRLKDDGVFRDALVSGSDSRDFFGFAQGKEGDRYLGFSFGKRYAPILDSSLLLIEPQTAAAYEEAQRLAEEGSRVPPKPDETGTTASGSGGSPRVVEDVAKGGGQAGWIVPKKRFYGRIMLDPVTAKKQFADVVDEVLQHFTVRPGIAVKIVIEIEADAPAGFDHDVQRTVRENCAVLRFESAEFEAGE